VVEVCFPPVPVHDDRVPALIVLVPDVQRLVHITDEVRQEHEALRQVIWLHIRMFRNSERLILFLLD